MRLYRFVLLSLFVFSGLAEARDSIRLKNGKELEVVITKETKTHIEFKDAKTGASQKKSVDELVRVLYEDANPNYVSMAGALDSGDYLLALKSGIKAKGSQKDSEKNWHSSYIDFYIGFCLYKLSEKSPETYAGKAIGFLKKTAASHAESRFGTPASYYLAGSLAIKGDYVNASKLYQKVAKDKARPFWVKKARVAEVNLLMMQKKYDDALSACESEMKAGNLSPELLSIYTTLLIEKKKDYQKAYSIAEKLVCRGDQPLKAAVYELKGCAAFHLKKYEDGLDSLLRATLLADQNGSASSRANVYLAGTIKSLLLKKSSQYGTWEYQSKLSSCIKKMSVADQKMYMRFKL
jgi:hypothetical protein